VSEWGSSSRTVQPCAGTGSPAAIFCPTKRPNWDANQPGLHRRLVCGSGQWLLTHTLLHRMEISACECFIISWRGEWEIKRAIWKAARCCGNYCKKPVMVLGPFVYYDPFWRIHWCLGSSSLLTALFCSLMRLSINLK